ncbi:uncharacterized protein LOC131667623 [Phymastichus coffea]|uniref:uncharacterized protein LOC131667623 n=1 Tax=Phymastichus coffea TaxID=108790 RepID=UPI00273A80AE|nr:uncharacterized protein LOC131667623 [Phymastichus coffea]
MESKKSQELNNTSEHNVGPVEAPPSYYVAVGNTPYNQPTAPGLETESTNPSANSVLSRDQCASPGPPPIYTVSDPRFAQGDDRATRILITNRLRMNDQFNQARNQQERDILWNLILIDLINEGYCNFILHNVIDFWRFQYYIYQSIINGLTSNSSNNWQFLEPMHNVFGSSGGSNFTSDVLSSDHNIFPSSGLDSLPSSSINTDPSILQNSTDINHSMSYLPVPVPSLSSIPPADVATASAVGPSLGDHISSGDVIPSGDATANLISAINTTSNNIGSDVITSQPIESLVPVSLNDIVITNQPTISSPPLTANDTNHTDGCCGGDGGCGGGNEHCCGGNDDCCGGNDDCCDGDCYVGCDDCGDCNVCELIC